MERLATVAIVGVGLIGGSVGLALRARHLATRVVGVGRNEASLDEALRLGSIDSYTTDLASGVAEADVVVVCTPVHLIAGAVLSAAEYAPSGALITDAGSTKRTIVESVEQDPCSRLVFVGGHPIAGSERKGPTHSNPGLFDGRVCVLTPTPRTPADRLRRAREFWTALGCQVVELDPQAHDEALALTSHLPHAVAAALAATVPAATLGLAAGAYRDGTRVAGSDPELWADIFLANKIPLLQALSRFHDQLTSFRRAIEGEDEKTLRAWWEVGRHNRSQFDVQGHKPGNED